MRARWLLNLLLLLVVAGLVTLAYLRPGLNEEEPPDFISPSLPEQIQQLKISRPGSAPITLTRTTDGWWLTFPINMAANHFRIEPLLQLRRAVSHSSFPVVAAALAQYGLDQPSVELQMDGEHYVFGNQEPLNGYRYTMFAGNVHLISDRIHHYLLMSAHDFVSLQIVPSQQQLIEVQFESNTLRDDLLLEAWSELHARRVSPYTHKQGTRLDIIDSVEQLLLVLGDGTKIQFDILQREPELVLGLREKKIRYHITMQEGERLLPMMGDGGA